MKSEKFYDDWKKQRSHVEVGDDFAEKVMNQVYQYEQKKSVPLLDVRWFFEFVSTNSLAKIALFVSGGLLGLARIVFIVCVFLRP